MIAQLNASHLKTIKILDILALEFSSQKCAITVRDAIKCETLCIIQSAFFFSISVTFRHLNTICKNVKVRIRRKRNIF